MNDRKTIDVRLLKEGDTLDNIPLIRCPVCSKTAFSLSPTAFCHVVKNLTSTTGDVVDFCEVPQQKKSQ